MPNPLAIASGVWKVGNWVATKAPVIKDAFDGKKVNPSPSDKTESAVIEIANLNRSFKNTHDSDGDGKADWTPREATEFLSQVLNVVSKHV